ncbi:CubicO group peptidase, beta-lactamase class C family [Muriicola jejuensis]|uniref:Serine hydrolase n=1 Tax=Muriicola jejuensis TaxID=504488 RepID=A0A6P0U8B2_9FLAO|nr:serine hydrolase domain-containing protein [Muriicola jejuensis]NER09385.1 serine hydrolase [Muriicola jejuensis]SMP08971.1 CubicO group peptidase, beta-lactamase class C family [Muriicola jejuensis]
MRFITDFFKTLFSAASKQENVNSALLLDSSFQELVDERKVPGMALTVLHSGKTLYQKGFGYADLEKRIPVDPRKTLFRIASASKPLAAMALARMVADKEIDLDESLYTYVPYFPKKEYDFTLRQLAGHTAGIRGYKGREYARNESLSIRDSLAIFQDDPLQFKPGTGFLYNSFDWVLISLAMEEVSGMPFSAYVKEKVLRPLNMEHTFEETPGNLPDHAAVCYTRSRSGFRPAIPVDNRYKLAGGGYLSTSEDLARLGRACLDDSLLPSEVMRAFLTAQEVEGQSTYYGLGWQVSRDAAGREFVGHVGNGVGGYSNFFVYPKEEIVVSLLINCTDPKVQHIIDQGLDHMFSALKDFYN